jgi:hypothetical protein
MPPRIAYHRPCRRGAGCEDVIAAIIPAPADADAD